MEVAAYRILELIVYTYVAGLFILIAAAFYFPKEKRGKIKAIVKVILIYIISPIICFIFMIHWGRYTRRMEDVKKNAEFKKVHPPAKALFDARCATAQEKVYKTVENVEGILLLDVRKDNSAIDDQYWPDAALPREFFYNNYIESFLDSEYKYDNDRGGGFDIPNRNYAINGVKSIEIKGYSYVDVKEGGEFVRYKYKEAGSNKLLREYPPPDQLSRYAVSFVNDTNPSDRAHWVAGTTVTVTDTWSKEVIAEKTWYSLAITRPKDIKKSYSWEWADVCPEMNIKYRRSYARYPSTRKFVEQVLQPKQEY